MSDSTTVVGLLGQVIGRRRHGPAGSRLTPALSWPWGQLEAEFAAVQRENRALRARVANLEAALATAAVRVDCPLSAFLT